MHATQNLARCCQAICEGSAPQAVCLRLSAILRVRTPQLVALLLALGLGLLNPLSCVIHCFVQELLTERPALTYFLCSEHSPTQTTALAARFSASSTRAAPEPSSSPPSTITPRALYELVALATPLLMVVSLLMAVLLLLPARCFVPQTLPPPTPPPRHSHT